MPGRKKSLQRSAENVAKARYCRNAAKAAEQSESTTTIEKDAGSQPWSQPWSQGLNCTKKKSNDKEASGIFHNY
jgi:hypothetical protein